MTATTTSVAAPFTWSGDHVAVELPHGVHALFTTRRGGVSAPPFDTLNLGRWTDDDPAATEENRRRLLALVGADRLAYGHQVHGTTVVRDGSGEDADGQVTTSPGVAVMALTADCLPIALAAPEAVAMLHAGWRGLADGIVEEGVRALRAAAAEASPEGAPLAAPLTAAVGPGARGCCYEVGDDVRAAFGLEPLGAPAPIDLPAIARERLLAAGVGEVHDCGLCTMCGDPSLFFSHRRDSGRTGRQAGVAWR